MPSADLVERLRRLGFRVKADALAPFLAHVHKSRLGPTETIEQLVDLEMRARDAVNLARRTRFACLGSFTALDRFDWSHPEKIDRALIERLMALDFVERRENVLLKGGSGLGKSMIAQNLGVAALAAGYSVRFSTLAFALSDLLAQESMPAFERRLRRYLRPDVLILDELGYLPCDSRAADILYCGIRADGTVACWGRGPEGRRHAATRHVRAIERFKFAHVRRAHRRAGRLLG